MNGSSPAPRHAQLSWGWACLFPLASITIVTTTIGSPEHIYFPHVPTPLRVFLLLLAATLPIYGASLADHTKPTPKAIPFLVLLSIFAVALWTCTSDASENLSGGQRALLAFVLVMYDILLFVMIGVWVDIVKQATAPGSVLSGPERRAEEGMSNPSGVGDARGNPVGLPAYEALDGDEAEEGAALLGTKVNAV